MAASEYENEVSRAIRDSANKEDNPSERCVKGGLRSVTETGSNKIPIIREWEIRRFAGDCFFENRFLPGCAADRR